jgi:hypothetical protein
MLEQFWWKVLQIDNLQTNRDNKEVLGEQC